MSPRPAHLDVPALEALTDPQRVGVVGCGLIGGSILLRCRDVGLPVVALDTDADVAASVRARGIPVVDDLADLVADCDLIVVAVSPERVASVWQQIVALRREGDTRLLVVDVSSTKSPVVAGVEAGAAGWSSPSACLMLSHPMAGREQAGWPAALPDLFADAAWIMCPHADVRADELARMLRFIARMGARGCAMPAERHDRFAALVSHLPHLLAFAYRHLLEEVDPAGAWWRFSGGSLADVLRVSDSDPALWREILRGNDDELARAAEQLTARMQARWQAVDAPSGVPGGVGESPAAATRLVVDVQAALGSCADELASSGLDGLEVVDARIAAGRLEIDLDRRTHGAVASRFTPPDEH
ncbi:MAG: prephenate dehydrogenase/arogenate dehydrogenase family protein [Nitriliruptoraceae bacterium]